MRIGGVVMASISTLALGACANLDSIYRPLDLQGSAVAVDAKQRGIYSTKMKVKSDATQQPVDATVLCAEPSPDALSAYAASGGITGLIKSVTGSGESPSAQAQAAFAAGETTASIGLRTQSIQLLRDGLFSNCLAYMNQAVNGDQFFQLQRRSQNFTLGLLAIEQLTGAVKADQAALSTSSGAATGSDDVAKQQSSVDDAEKALNSDQEALEKARAAQRLAEAEERESRGKLAAAEDARKKAPSDASADAKKALDTGVEEAKADLKTKSTTAGERAIETQKQARAVAASQRRLETANTQLTLALGRVKAFANGTAQLVAAQSRAMVADHVSKAVTKIVDTVLDHSGLAETCLLLVANLSSVSDVGLPPYLRAIGVACPQQQREAAAAAVANKATTSPERARQELRLPPAPAPN